MSKRQGDLAEGPSSSLQNTHNKSLLLKELDPFPGLFVEHFYSVFEDLFLLFEVLDLLNVVLHSKINVTAGLVHLLYLVVGTQVGLSYMMRSVSGVVEVIT